MLKKIIFRTLILMLIVSCRSVDTYNKQISKQHAVNDLKNDIDAVYKQLKRHHPRLYQYTSKEQLDFKIDSLKNSIQTPLSSREFYKVLAPVIANVRQGHVSVGSASKRFNKKERKNLKKQKFEFYDLDFEFLDNKLWVSRTITDDSILVGCRVLKIDDEFVDDLILKFKTRFASDGFNKTLFNRYVGNQFSTLFFKDKGFQDSLSITFKQNDSIYIKTFKRVLKDKKLSHFYQDSVVAMTKIKLSKSQKRQHRMALREKRLFNKTHGYNSKDKSYTRNFNILKVDSTVAVMKIRSFSNGNYKRFYKESFSVIKSENIQNLILDLRDNGGGRIAEIDYLYGYLTLNHYKLINESEVTSRLPYFKYLMSNTTPSSIKIATTILSPFIAIHNLIKTKKHDGKLFYNLRFTRQKEPKKINFKGNLYVLINGNSFSASSLLSTHLQATNRAIFVGEETGGAYNGCVAGIYKIYKLPNTKLNIRMGLMQIETPYKQTPDGYGIKPDVKILPTSRELMLGKDSQLDWVLDDIKNK